MTETDWEQREQPVLEAIFNLEESGKDATNDRVAEATGLGLAVVGKTMKRLDQARFIEAADAVAMGDQYPVYVGAEILERGLRVVGAWPPDAADAFVRSLETAISNETDPEERSRLQQLKEATAEVSKAAIAGAIVAAGQWGLS